MRFSSRVVISLALLGAACSTHPGGAAGRGGEAADGTVRVEGDPMGVVTKKLPNGLTLMLSENHEEPRIETRIAVRAGSAKDPADATGLAHYLEHMNFKGTSKLGTLDWEKEKPHLDRIQQVYDELFRTTDPAAREKLYKEIDAENQAACKFEVPNELDTLYDGFGARALNAHTSDDETVYEVNIPSNRLDTWATVETERFRDPVYRLFQSELEAVYEEKNLGMDNKFRIIGEALALAMFPEHPYGTQTTIGTVEHLKNPSLTKIIDYFRKWYVPGNMLVAISGDFDTKEALAVLEKHFGTWAAKPVPPDPVFPIAPPSEVRRVDVKFMAEEQVMLAWLTVPEGHPDHDALMLADTLLSNNHTGLIDVNIVKEQRTNGAGASPRIYAEAGGEIAFGVPNPRAKQTLEDVEKLLLEQIEHLEKGDFTDEDLAAAVNEFDINEKQGLESNTTRVVQMVQSFIHRQPWERHVQMMDRLRAVTKADVVRVANEYFARPYVAVYRRKGAPDLPRVAKPPFTPVQPSKEHHSPYFQEIAALNAVPIEPHFVEKGRDYQTQTLATGELVWTKNPMNDLFQLSFTFDVGTDTDPKLETACQLLDFGGAGALDPVGFERKLYALGTTLSVGAGRQETTVTLSGLDANLPESLDLLRAHFAEPTGVTQETLGGLVQRTVGGRQQRKIQLPVISGALNGYATRGADSDLLHQPSNAELATWKAEDLMASAQHVWDFRRHALYVGPRAVGDVAKLVDIAPPGGGDAKEPPPRTPVRVVVPEKPRVLLVDVKGAQAQVALYIPDGLYDRPAVPTHRVYSEYMGGSMGSVVFQEVREFRSLAYAVGAFYRDAAWKDDSNVFSGQLGTQPDKTLDALEVLLRIVKDMPPSESRMANVKRTLDETYRSQRIGFRAIPASVVTWSRQGLDGDPRPWNWEQVKKMTLDDIAAFAARWKTKPYTIAIAGDKSRFDMAKLAQYGDVVEMKPDQLFSW